MMICYLENQQYDQVQQATPAPGNLASRWWYSEERIPAQVEVLLVLYVLLVAIQVVFGFWRRSSSSAFIKYSLWLAYSASQPLATYALGLMHYSSFNDSMLQLWSVLLVYRLGSLSITAYNVDDNKQYMTHIFHQVLFVVNFSYMVSCIGKIKNLKTVFMRLLIISDILIVSAMKFGTIFANMRASSFSDKGSLNLQLYMTTEHMKSREYDPVTLRGYNYIVGVLRSNKNIITVSQVWLSDEGPLQGSDGTRLKEVCLSFALYQLLRRRFFGVPFPEANLQKTHDLIFQGLLLNVDENYQAAYRIIETELAFTHNSFFTSSQPLYTRRGGASILMSILHVTALDPIAIVGSILSFLYCKNEPGRTVPGGRIRMFITIVIMALCLTLELLQIYVLVSSDWAKVQLVCLSFSRKFSFVGIYRFGNKLPQQFGYWQNKIGQHSLLKDLHRRSLTADVTGSLSFIFHFLLGYDPAFHRGILHPGVRGPDRIRLTNDVKLAVARALKASNCKLSNGESSLRRNGLNEHFLWACEQRIHHKNMLLWHIATEYCDIAQSLKAEKPDDSVLDHSIAREISSYCAYLMAFVPELLPDHHLETTSSFNEVRNDALNFLREDRSLQSKYTKMRNYNNQDKRIFFKAIRLGKNLEEIADDGRRWKILAVLWTKMILYIAPSDNAKDHIQHLANGGEFITHLWALLSHAGILERDQHNPSHPRAEIFQNSVRHQAPHEENSATHETAASPDHLEQMSDNLQPDPLPPRWMRRATEFLFLTRSWNVFNSVARRAMLVPASLMVMSGFALQAPSPPGVQAMLLPLLTPLEMATANECRIDVPEAWSSTQQALPVPEEA